MAAGGWKDWTQGDLVSESEFQDIQDSIAFIYASESAANTALTNKVEGTQFYDTTDDVIKIWDGSAWNVVQGDCVLLASNSSGGSSITFSNLLDKSIYNSFKLIVHGLRPTVSNASLRLKALDSSDNIINGTYRRGQRFTQANGTNHTAGESHSYTNYVEFASINGLSGDTQNFIFDIFPEDDVFHNSHINFTLNNTSGGNTWQYNGMILTPTGISTAFKGINLVMSSGNLSIVNVGLWGFKK